RAPATFDYELSFVGRDEREADDRVLAVAGGEGDASTKGFEVFVDPATAELVAGTTVDFLHTLERIGFEFDNPQATWGEPLADAVQQALDDEVNPRVGSHGGVVALREVRDGVAYLEMGGGCQGCGKAEATLRDGVERLLADKVPELRGVVDVTDHEAGDNPFFAPGEGGSSPLAG
ncbi:MAG TPA: NifU family protein, partial [Thermoanaerobaculia bacterium]|nr:NifU family protein [Thermoanaerobaculia bacterium]